MAKYTVKERKKDKEFLLSKFTDLYNTKAQCEVCQEIKWCQQINIIFTNRKEAIYLCESCFDKRKENSTLTRIIFHWNSEIRKNLGLTSDIQWHLMNFSVLNFSKRAWVLINTIKTEIIIGNAMIEEFMEKEFQINKYIISSFIFHYNLLVFGTNIHCNLFLSLSH